MPLWVHLDLSLLLRLWDHSDQSLQSDHSGLCHPLVQRDHSVPLDQTDRLRLWGL